MRYHLISRALESNSSLQLSRLCQCAQVSKSGFYRWVSRPEKERTTVEALILKLFKQKKQKAGYRTIKMLLLKKYDLKVNHKKIRRIMKNENLWTKIRRRKKHTFYNVGSRIAEPYPNLVKQRFDPPEPDQIYSADISHLFFGRSQKAYLFAAKDLCAKDIVSHDVSASPDSSLVTKKYKEYLKKLPEKIRQNLISHTDQGSQFQSDCYAKSLEILGVQRSMSRKGNCLDNSPIESFFGHMKDEVDLKNCKNLADVKRIVSKYINDYNHHRPQWGLNGMTPAERRGQFELSLF